jgi:hypothetical protein
MFPLYLLLSPQATLTETPTFPAKIASEPATTRPPVPPRMPPGARKERRATWALTWLGPETAIVPPTGMNVPEMGR